MYTNTQMSCQDGETECVHDAAERGHAKLKDVSKRTCLNVCDKKSGFVMCLILERIAIFDCRFRKMESCYVEIHDIGSKPPHPILKFFSHAHLATNGREKTLI